jgi:cytochrome c oxidase assembly protein subunit 11
MRSPEEKKENRRLLKKLLVVVVGMFGFGFLLVPLYQQICETTGINNVIKPDVVAASEVANTQIDRSRSVTVEFDSNLRSDLPWSFRPLEASIRVHPGELSTVVYEVRNNASRPITGQAIPSYGPALAGKHFRKLECFCFTQQTLAPGEVRQMPVQFVLDHALPGEVNTITLSYTFFEIEGRKGS